MDWLTNAVVFSYVEFTLIKCNSFGEVHTSYDSAYVSNVNKLTTYAAYAVMPELLLQMILIQLLWEYANHSRHCTNFVFRLVGFDKLL